VSENRLSFSCLPRWNGQCSRLVAVWSREVRAASRQLSPNACTAELRMLSAYNNRDGKVREIRKFAVENRSGRIADDLRRNLRLQSGHQPAKTLARSIEPAREDSSFLTHCILGQLTSMRQLGGLARAVAPQRP